MDGRGIEGGREGDGERGREGEDDQWEKNLTVGIRLYSTI